jgi:hypothetical protein
MDLTFMTSVKRAKIRKICNSICHYEELSLTRVLLFVETCRNQKVTLQRPNQTELSITVISSPLYTTK